MANKTGKAQDLLRFTRLSEAMDLTRVKYGYELVTNTSFDSSSGGWTLSSGASIAGTGVTLTITSGGHQFATQTVAGMETGKCYRLLVTVSGTADKLVRFRDTNVGAGGLTANGADGSTRSQIVLTGSTQTVEFFFTATEDSAGVFIERDSGASTDNYSFTVTSLSIKEATLGDPEGELRYTPHPKNQPKVRYDKTGLVEGLAIEPARTNLIPNSDLWTGWAINGAVSKRTEVAPTTMTEASRVDLNTESGYVYDTGAVTAGQTYTASWFAKAGTATAWVLGILDETNNSWVKLEQYTLTSGEDVGNGWYRHHTTFVAPAGCTVIRVYPLRTNISGYITGTQGTTSLWTVQLEQSKYPTSPMRTLWSTTASRSADLCTMELQDFGYNTFEGSMYIDSVDMAEAYSTEDNLSGFHVYFGSDGVNYVGIRYHGSSGVNGQSYIKGGGATEVATINSAVAARQKIAVGWKLGESIRASGDGTSVDAQSATIPGNFISGETRDFVVSFASSASGVSGNIGIVLKDYKFYPRLLTDAQLEDLTS